MRYGTSAADFPRSSRENSPAAWRCSERLCHCALFRTFELMHEGKIGHHYAKGLGPIDSAENLSSNPLQFIGYFVCQRKHECRVDGLERNVQPLAVIERNELRLRHLRFETHDDVFSEGILLPDFEHGKELIEMALGESGIDGKSKLSALLCGRNDSALRSGCGLLRSGHVISLSRCILQHTYMRLENHSLINSNQRSSREGSAEGISGFIA